MTPRNRAIDAFRGLSVISMVFFTTILMLSRDLPDPLKHNVRDSVHAGDLVLPMFIFVSGMSLAYFINTRASLHPRTLKHTVLTRFVRLASVGILLSPYSTRGFLEMDEVMLSAICFLGCVAVTRLRLPSILAVIVLVNASYLVLLEQGWTGHFREFYLGGYLAALYYLPVMLIGYLMGEGTRLGEPWGNRNRMVFVFTLAMFLLTLAMTPPDKLSARPSFMMGAALICMGIYGLVDAMDRRVSTWGEVEYLGRRPFRYWISMYGMFIIPLKIHAERTSTRLPLNFPWVVAILSSLALLIALWIASKVMDHLFPPGYDHPEPGTGPPPTP